MCSGCNHRTPETASRASARAFDRRDFLRLTGAGLLGVVLLGSAGAGAGFARSMPKLRASLAAEFEAAAAEFGVPVDLLMAIGYVNTRWEMPSPETTRFEWGSPHGVGAYGMMALVQNPYANTLGEAAGLTGVPEERLKRDRAANIRGGAALLASSAGGYASGDPSEYFEAVAGRGMAAGSSYTAVSGIGGGELYAEQVFGTLRTGATRTLRSGETVTLPVRIPSFGLGNLYGR